MGVALGVLDHKEGDVITEHWTDDVPEQGEFRRVPMNCDDELVVTAGEKPVAVWLPSHASMKVVAIGGFVLDASEAVQHHDIISMEQKIREYDRRKRVVGRALRRAKRKLRGLERPDRL
jgi:hypothetical protein